MPLPDRRFNEREVAQILRRGAELQGSREGSSDTGGAGVSLDQLQQAAAEFGISPLVLAEAAAEIDRRRPPSILGGPGGTALEALVPAPVGDDQWPAIVEAIRRASGRVGVPGQVGSAYEWTSTSPDVIHLSLTPTPAGTSVRVTAKYGEWGLLAYVLASLVSLLGGVALASSLHLAAPAEAGIVLTWIAAAGGSARAVVGNLYAAKARQARDLMRAIVDQVGAGRAPAPATVTTRQPEEVSQQVGIVRGEW